MSDNLKAQLHDAFERKRYGGSGDYDPDFDLFDVAAAEIARLEAALREIIDTLPEHSYSRLLAIARSALSGKGES